MKKKVLLLASLSSIMAAGAVFGGLALGKNSSFEPVKATDKEFVFDATVATEQFDGSDFLSVVNRSVVTGVSSNIETSVSLDESGTQRQKWFGGGGNFVQSSGGLTAPYFSIEIGLNNITSVSVVFGLNTTSQYTTADQVGCSIDLYDSEGNIDSTASCGSANLDTEAVLTWQKPAEQTRVADSVIVDVFVPSGFVHYSTPLFIKSITVNWSC